MNNKYGILEYKLEDWHPNKYGYKSININDVGVELFDCLSYDEQDYVIQMSKYSHLNYDDVIKQYDIDTLPNYIKNQKRLGWECDSQGNIIGILK